MYKAVAQAEAQAAAEAGSPWHRNVTPEKPRNRHLPLKRRPKQPPRVASLSFWFWVGLSLPPCILRQVRRKVLRDGGIVLDFSFIYFIIMGGLGLRDRVSLVPWQ